MADLPKLADALPTLAAALRESLLREGEEALAEQIDEVRIHATCACDDKACRSVYLAPLEGHPCDGDYRVVLPDVVITIGVCQGRMEDIEDNALITKVDADAREREYRALEGAVGTRSPTDL